MCDPNKMRRHIEALRQDHASIEAELAGLPKHLQGDTEGRAIKLQKLRVKTEIMACEEELAAAMATRVSEAA